jgi:hypothetical protein
MPTALHNTGNNIQVASCGVFIKNKARLSRESVARQQEYYCQRAQQPPKTKLKTFTAEEKDARLQQIDENRRRREAEMEARRARGELKETDEKIARWAKQTQEKLALKGMRRRAV